MQAEAYFIDHDIKVLCLTASSFPDGVQAVHKKLHSLFPPAEGRTFYGISYPDRGGKIIYKAAADQLHEGDAAKFNLEAFTIREGKYICEVLNKLVYWPRILWL